MARESRWNVLAEIADLKAEEGLLQDALSLYMKYLGLLSSTAGVVSRLLASKKWVPTSGLRTLLLRLKAKFADYSSRARSLQERLRSTDLLYSAEKLIFEYALHSVRASRS